MLKPSHVSSYHKRQDYLIKRQRWNPGFYHILSHLVNKKTMHRHDYILHILLYKQTTKSNKLERVMSVINYYIKINTKKKKKSTDMI